MTNYVRFHDTVDLAPVIGETSQKVKDFYANPSNSAQPLKIRIAATHAGKITRNNGFYLPHKMKEGTGTWTKQYNKPIQVHHEDKKDPVGRVIAASYIDISSRVRDSLDTKNVWNDSVRPLSRTLDGFIKGTLSHREIMDFASSYFIKDSRLSEDPDYEGLGYIELIASITDPDAIQKVLDGRYLTGSVGAATNQAVCSNCKQNWAEEGPCDHKPGKVYDAVKCVLIAGDLFYDEYSLVNKPADRHSKIIEVNVNGVRDFVEMGEDEMTKDETIPEISLIKDNTIVPEVKVVDEIVPVTPPIVEEPKTEQTEIKDEMQIIKDFFGSDFDEITDGVWGVEYAKMMYGLILDASEDEKEAVSKEVKDAVLKSAERNKLSGKTFCGPDRSYPVPDCTHARAAVRLASHAANPSAITACAKRKAARLGCPIGEKKMKDALTPGDYSKEYFDAFDDEQLQRMSLGLVDALKERTLDCLPCNQIAESVRVKELEVLLDETRKAKGLDLADMENLNHALSDATAEIRTSHIHQICDLRILKGEKTTLDTIVLELKDKTGPEVREMLNELNRAVDMQKIADTLNSGLSNIKPEGEVSDPTAGIIDAIKQDGTAVVQNEIKYNLEIAKQIKLQALNIRRYKGPEAQDKFLEDCRNQGLIPNEIPVKG